MQGGVKWPLWQELPSEPQNPRKPLAQTGEPHLRVKDPGLLKIQGCTAVQWKRQDHRPGPCVLIIHCLQLPPPHPPLCPDIPILMYGIFKNLQETLPRATSTTCSMNSRTLMT